MLPFSVCFSSADRGHEKGFLLLEVLLAGSLLVMAMLAIGGLLLRLESEAGGVKHYQLARYFASECLAQRQYLLSIQGQQSLAAGSWVIGPGSRAGEEQRPGLERRYRCDWQIKRRAADTYQLVVEVSWQERGRQPKEIFRLQTMVSRRPYFEAVGKSWPRF